MKIASKEEIGRIIGTEKTWANIQAHALRARAAKGKAERTSAHAQYQLRQLALGVVFPPKKREDAQVEANPDDRGALRRKILSIIADDAIYGESAKSLLRSAILKQHIEPLRAQGRQEMRAKVAVEAETALSEARDGLDHFSDAVHSRAQALGEHNGDRLFRTVLGSLCRPYEKVRLGESILRE